MKSRKSNSFFALLVKSYLIFTLMILAVCALVFSLSMLFISGKWDEYDTNRIKNFQPLLEERAYAKLPVERLFGAGGYVFVMDAAGNTVYRSDPDKSSSVQFDEIAYIPHYSGEVSAYSENFINPDGEKNTLLTVINEVDEVLLERKYILDESLKILYPLSPGGKTALTPKEFALLTNTSSESDSIFQCPFTDTASGLPYTLLIYFPSKNEMLLYEKIQRISDTAVVLAVVVYIVLMACFILWLNRKVKKPLFLLQTALKRFVREETHEELTYTELREFADICGSFNLLAAQLRQSEAQREKLAQDKQKMLADISHDLKTPITVIKGYAKAINDGLVSEQEKAQYLSTIYQKADSLTVLINTFYDYSKLEHPDYRLDLAPCDICVFLRDFVADRYDELNIAGFHVLAEIPEQHILCRADRLHLTRAIENIVANAMKHNPSGTGLLFMLVPQQDKVDIYLADNGCGIPQEIGEKIFEPFVVGESSRSRQGSGLGLSISKKIIEMHGGCISLAKKPGKGYRTEIIISLPLIDTGAQAGDE